MSKCIPPIAGPSSDAQAKLTIVVNLCVISVQSNRSSWYNRSISYRVKNDWLKAMVKPPQSSVAVRRIRVGSVIRSGCRQKDTPDELNKNQADGSGR